MARPAKGNGLVGIGTFWDFKKDRVESFAVLLLFALSWLGYGVYASVLLVVLFTAALFFRNRRLFVAAPLSDRPLMILLGIFILNNIVSSLLSVDKLVSTLLSVVWFLLIYLPIAYVRFSLNEESDFFMRIIVPLGFVISLVILFSLCALFSINVVKGGAVWKRHTFFTMSTGSTPDMICMLGGIGYGFIRQQRKIRYRWLGLLYLLLCFAGIAFVGDRGGMMALLVMSILLLCFDYKRLVLFFVLLGIIVVLSYRMESLDGIRSMYDYLYRPAVIAGLKNRTQILCFRQAWGMIKDHWLFGVGTNNFWKFSDMYGPRKFAYAHNIVLQFWAENGIVGMLAGLGILGLLIRRWIRTLGNGTNRYIVLGMGAGFVAMLVGQLTNCTIWAFQTAIPFWLLAGAINAAYYTVEKPELSEFSIG
ncbi:MAG: O-antigen ligase family protein [Spirochaetes bacterium]|nr:O-antigen ligase family protein [Spirochaetota bacterium]